MYTDSGNGAQKASSTSEDGMLKASAISDTTHAADSTSEDITHKSHSTSVFSDHEENQTDTQVEAPLRVLGQTKDKTRGESSNATDSNSHSDTYVKPNVVSTTGYNPDKTAGRLEGKGDILNETNCLDITNEENKCADHTEGKHPNHDPSKRHSKAGQKRSKLTKRKPPKRRFEEAPSQPMCDPSNSDLDVPKHHSSKRQKLQGKN
jgi:hypothetical protein